MTHSACNPQMNCQAGITIAVGIECLNRAEILPPGNTGFSMRRKADAVFPDSGTGELAVPLSSPPGSSDNEHPLWQRLHCFIYRQRTDVKVLITSRLPYTLTAAGGGRKVPPLLDDFAQIVGVTARVVQGEKSDPRFPVRVLKGLKRRNAVLIPEWGGLCAAASFDDALAVVQVLEKGCRAHIDSAFLGGGFRINPVEAWLMRLVYKYKYSKMKV
jgi:L-fuculose-phosphate aldolase